MKNKILIVCNDAGAGEMLSALVFYNLGLCNWYVLGMKDSPAKNIFYRRGLDVFWTDIELIDDIDQFLQMIAPNYLFYGTGWQIRVEEHFVRWAKASGVISVAFLEHWVNYRERFGYPDKDWKHNLPDWVAVGDEVALQLAMDLGFERLLYVKNYYFYEILSGVVRRGVDDVDLSSGGEWEPFCLFVSEPVSEGAERLYGDRNYWGFSEIDAIEILLQHFEIIASQLDVKKFFLRFHPSENPNKYNELLSRYPFILSLQSPFEITLREAILRSRIVMGFTSMALFNAYLSGKPVISFIPSERMTCVLPIPQCCKTVKIEQLLGIDLKQIPLIGMDNRFSQGMPLEELLNFLQENRHEDNSYH